MNLISKDTILLADPYSTDRHVIVFGSSIQQVSDVSGKVPLRLLVSTVGQKYVMTRGN